MHSFSLTQIVLPYAKNAGLNLPDDFRIASIQEQRAAMERAYDRAIGGPDDPHRKWRLPMDHYRRSILDRSSEQWRTQDETLASLVETYENELRRQGLIDFDDMPLLALRALIQHEWVRRAILAKYPVLAVDEYQDLGHALHKMVMGLCFSTGIRLFAVGDADQSIYGFTGANPVLLQRLSEREDVETITLPFNYRCGSRIVMASEYALGEERGYQAPEGTAEGTIYFRPSNEGYAPQANDLFTTILPEAFSRIPDLSLGQIAILYQAAYIGDDIAVAAQENGLEFIRTDSKALYPRFSRVMRWIELCAIWSCSGWQKGTPRFSKLVSEAMRIFSEALVSDKDKARFQRTLLRFLWSNRNANLELHDWLQEIKHEMLGDFLGDSRTLSDEVNVLEEFLDKIASGGTAEGMTLGQFSGQGEGSNQITLSTLHSAKGREFRIVVLFGMDEGRIPRSNAGPREQRESRRLFYVGFTRAEEELHIMYSNRRPSPFVLEVQQRLQTN